MGSIKRRRVKQHRKVLITGYCRSGTTWMTKALNAVGIDVKHEAMGADGSVSCLFWIDAPKYITTPEKWGLPPRHPEGRLSDFEFDVVLHQTRNPIVAIASQEKSYNSAYKQWLADTGVVGMNLKPNLRHAMHMWMLATQATDKLVEKHGGFQYQIEQVDDHWDHILHLFGREPCPIPDIPPTVNRGTGFAKPKVRTGADYRKCDALLWDMIIKQAEEYGYVL